MNIFPLGRDMKITAYDNGNIGDLGPAGVNGWTGTLMLHFVPSLDFTGGFGILGRVETQKASDNNVGFASIPYRRVVMQGVASDFAIVSDLTNPGMTTLTGDAILQVTGNLSVGILIACTTGSCWIYQSRLQGSSTV